MAAPVCTPSLAGLLTGRLPVRPGMYSDQTAAMGKWHLGHKSPYLLTDHGFDSYFGTPNSNEMYNVEKTSYFSV